MSPEFPLSNPMESWGVWIFALCIGVVYGLRSYFGGPECRSTKNLKGRVTVVTGVSEGSVGEQVAMDFANRGAKVFIACKPVETDTKNPPSEPSQNPIQEKLRKRTENKEVHFIPLDLMSMKSIKSFVDTFIASSNDQLDILVNCAGVMLPPFAVSAEGFESQFQINFLGQHYLTQLLMPTLKRTAATSADKEARVVNVTCRAFELAEVVDLSTVRGEKVTGETYDRGFAYTRSKIVWTLASLETSRRCKDDNVMLNLVHPGVVNSNHGRHMPLLTNSLIKIPFYPLFWLMTKSSWNGSQSIIYCALAEALKGVTGKYYVDLFEKEITGVAADEAAAKQIFEEANKWILEADKSQ